MWIVSPVSSDLSVVNTRLYGLIIGEGVLDSVEKGKRVSEVGYRMIEDPVRTLVPRSFQAKETSGSFSLVPE